MIDDINKGSDNDLYEVYEPGCNENINDILIELGLPIFDMKQMMELNGTKSTVPYRDDLVYYFISANNDQEYSFTLWLIEEDCDVTCQKVDLIINIELKIVTIKNIEIRPEMGDFDLYESIKLNFQDLGNNQPCRDFLYTWLYNCHAEKYSFK